MSEMKRSDEDDEIIKLVESAVLDLGLPFIAALSGWLPLVLLGSAVRGGRSFASAVKSKQVRAEIDGLRDMVRRVERRLRRDLVVDAERLRALLERPDVLKLLAQARDDYAVASMQPRLERLAAVVAGRAPRAEDDIDQDLRFARAALEVPDEGVELLATMVARGESDVKRRANQDPKSWRIVWGQMKMSDFLAKRSRRDQQDVDAAVSAVSLAERHGLMMRGEERPPTMVGRPPAVGELRCTDGTTAYFPNETWWPTPTGFEFVHLLRENEVARGGSVQSNT